MYRNRPLDLCRPTFFEVTPRVLRQRASNTRHSLACASAHAHAHTYARVPARTRTHSARHAAGMTPSGVARQPPDRPPRPPSAPSIGPPGRDWPPICTGGSRHKRDASAENGTLAEFLGVSQYRCRTSGGDRAVAGPFSVGPPGDGYPMATLLSITRVPGCSAHAPAHAPIRARAVNRAEDCLCFKQNLLKSVKRS